MLFPAKLFSGFYLNVCETKELNPVPVTKQSTRLQIKLEYESWF